MICGNKVAHHEQRARPSQPTSLAACSCSGASAVSQNTIKLCEFRDAHPENRSLALTVLAGICHVASNPTLTVISYELGADTARIVFPLWTRMAFGAIMVGEFVHFVVICHAFARLGLPSSSYDVRHMEEGAVTEQPGQPGST